MIGLHDVVGVLLENMPLGRGEFIDHEGVHRRPIAVAVAMHDTEHLFEVAQAVYRTTH